MGKDVDLIQAVKDEDLAIVQKLLGKSSASNTKKSTGSLKHLNINQQDADGLSVLHHAALVGNSRLMKLLLEHGIKIDVKDNKGLRPLHYAAWLGKDSPVELLLESGSQVNDPALDGCTPLHLGCEHGHSDVVKKLLEYKGDPCLTNKQHKTPLDLACEFGRKRVVELLLTCDLAHQLRLECSKDILDNNRTTCLHLAARNGHTDVLKLLLDFSFNINWQTPNGTCLHEAAKYCKIEVVRLLLSYGIDVSRLNSYEETALDIVNKFTATKAAKELKQMLKEAGLEILARAIKDYSKLLDATHLTFKEGDIIMVVDHYARNGLWKGYCASTSGGVTPTGYFPSDAVVILDPRPAFSKTSFDQKPSVCISAHHNGTLTGQSSPSPSGVQLKQVHSNYLSHNPLLGIGTSSCIDVCPDSGLSVNNCYSESSNGVVEMTDGLQNRLSGNSSESGVSGISFQPSSRSTESCSQGSLDHLDESGYSSSSIRVHELAQSDLPDAELLSLWLRDLGLDEFTSLFLNAGYDLPTVSRMTPEDLTAIGITQPSVRKKLKSEMAKLTISDGIPDFIPRNVKEWLAILHLSEYHDMLIHQRYTDVDAITGIMWEDLEEIGIRKLGHQKKIMLAIDRLKKINGNSHPHHLPLTSKVSSEDSDIRHCMGGVPTSSNAMFNSHSQSFTPAVTLSRSCDITRHMTSNCITTHSLIYSTCPGGISSVASEEVFQTPSSLCRNAFPVSCQSYSYRLRNCENVDQADIIGPAPSLPSRCRNISGLSSTLTRDGMFPFPKESGYLSLIQQDLEWSPIKYQVAAKSKLKANNQQFSFDKYGEESMSMKDYHPSYYGTLPRRQLCRSKLHYGAVQFQNKYADCETDRWLTEQASNLEPIDIQSNHDRHLRKPLHSTRRMNSFKNDTHPFGIAGEKLRSEAVNRNEIQSYARRLFGGDTGNNLKSLCDANYGLSSFSKIQAFDENRTASSNKIVKANHVDVRNCNESNIGDTESNRVTKVTENEVKGDTAAKRDSDFSGCRNMSSVSLDSSGSSGTLDSNTLPFANEDAGTIKGRTATNGYSGDGPSSLECSTNMEKNNSNIHSTPDLNLQHQIPVVPDAGLHRRRSISCDGDAETVFKDIDGMLLGLAQELDEMLKLQV